MIFPNFSFLSFLCFDAAVAEVVGAVGKKRGLLFFHGFHNLSIRDI